MAEFSENRHISNLINMSCKVLIFTDVPSKLGFVIRFLIHSNAYCLPGSPERGDTIVESLSSQT